MHPFLFDWVVNDYHFRPPSYGVMLALSFSIGYFFALRRAVNLSVDPRHVENLFLIAIAGSIVGGRLFHVAFEEPGYYIQNPMKILAVWEGGYTFYGSLFGAIVGLITYCSLKEISYLTMLEIGSESCAFGLFTGRIGCFLAGCCWGKPTTMPWGVVFSNPESFTAVHNLPLHPSQLYESFGALLMFFYVRWRFNHRTYDGQVFFHTIFFYAVLRFIVEFFRGDEYRGYIFGGLLSYGQFISLVLIPFAVWGMVTYSKKAPLVESVEHRKN